MQIHVPVLQPRARQEMLRGKCPRKELHHSKCLMLFIADASGFQPIKIPKLKRKYNQKAETVVPGASSNNSKLLLTAYEVARLQLKLRNHILPKKNSELHTLTKEVAANCSRIDLQHAVDAARA